ncbi:MAG: tetratricopeptide repeat protein, partial [Planctomycetes bacterium]|nr:tetratricopeptide repeat protein [Planctomycetota bacterium]
MSKCKKQLFLKKASFKRIILWPCVVVCLFLTGCGEKSIKTNLKLAADYNNQGNTYAEKGEYEQAISNFNKALEINPKYAQAYYNRGKINGSIGLLDLAI